MTALTTPQAFGQQVAEARKGKHWTQERLSAELDKLGVKIHSTAITKLEKAGRKVSIDEAMAIAIVLDTSPAALLVKLGSDAVELAPEVVVPPVEALAWLCGFAPLAQQNRELFYASTLSIARTTPPTVATTVTVLRSLLDSATESESHGGADDGVDR